MTKKAILIAGHGSSSDANESAVKKQADMLIEKGYDNVYYGFKGYSEPYIQNVLAELADNGFDDVIAVPMFIAGGHYINRVIPKRLGLNENAVDGTSNINGKNVRVRITGPFGTHPYMTEVIINVIERNPMEKNTGVLLIGHGSKSMENHDMVKNNAERLRKIVKNVYYSFNEFNSPGVEDALFDMADNDIENIIVIPLFVSPGGHTDDDLPDKLGLIRGDNTGTVTVNGKRMNVVYNQPIGMEPGINKILEELIKPLL